MEFYRLTSGAFTSCRVRGSISNGRSRQRRRQVTHRRTALVELTARDYAVGHFLLAKFSSPSRVETMDATTGHESRSAVFYSGCQSLNQASGVNVTYGEEHGKEDRDEE